MNILNKYKKNILIIIAYIVVLLFIITAFHVGLANDESFTMGLVDKKYLQIINLDSLDVHPPLYYLCLKVFIQGTTFWTNSFFIKVIVARIFSLLALILFLYYIHKIFIIYNIHIPFKTYVPIFLLMPLVLFMSLNIRMYSLASLFLLIEFYALICYKKLIHKNYYLFVVGLFAILTSYTLYFSAISAELFIIIYITLFLFKKEYILTFKLLLVNLIIFIIYLPWIPKAYHQTIMHSKDDSGSSNSILYYIKNIITSLTQIGRGYYMINIVVIAIMSSVLLVLFVILIYYMFNKKSLNKLNNIVWISIINNILTLIISLIICKNKFQFIACYPIFTICALFFSLFVTLIIIRKYFCHRLFYKLVTILMICICLMYLIPQIYTNIYSGDIPSIQLIRNFHNWKHNNSNKLLLYNNDLNNNAEFYYTQFQNSLYLKSINKKDVIKNSNYSIFAKYSVNDRKNEYLVKHVFVNLKPR